MTDPSYITVRLKVTNPGAKTFISWTFDGCPAASHGRRLDKRVYTGSKTIRLPVWANAPDGSECSLGVNAGMSGRGKVRLTVLSDVDAEWQLLETGADGRRDLPSQ